MRKFIYGIIIGFILAIFFIVFGGGKYVERFGIKTERAGQEIVEYEKELKEKIESARRKVGKKTGELKEGVIEKKERVQKYVD